MVVLSTLSVKVIDFGLAKQLDNASLISRMYTPMYFSPEQTIMGAEVGPQSDVWAVGVLIFHCMTGTLPFGRLGDSIEVIVHEIRYYARSVAGESLASRSALTSVHCGDTA